MNLITSIPFTITTPGVWKLAHSFDLATSEPIAAIVLGCDDIVLKPGDGWLINSAGFDGQATGVYGLNRSRCSIEGGWQIFGAGFRHAIHLENTDGQTSDGRNTIIGNTRLSANYRAVVNGTKQAVILRNVVCDVGGATWKRGLRCFGIENFGEDTVIAENLIEEVYGDAPNNGESVGISLSHGGSRTTVRGNHIRNRLKVERSIAIWTGDPQEDIRLVDNVIENYKRAVWGTTQTGIADGNRTFNVGPLDGEEPHAMFDISGLEGWPGSDMGT